MPSFLQTNARSIRCKIDELRLCAHDYSPAFIVITETWLDETDDTCYYRVPNYNDPLRSDRQGRIGGGVMLYTHSQIGRVTSLPIINGPPEIELMLCFSEKFQMLICSAYILPNLSRSNNETIRCFLIDTIDTALLERPNSWVLICGDLNQAFIGQELTPLMDSLDLTNVVDCNTTKNSMLVVFLVPASMTLGYRPVTCSAPIGNSDHFVCRLSPNYEELMEFASHPIYDLRASRVSGFVNTLSTVNFHQLYHASNIDTKS